MNLPPNKEAIVYEIIGEIEAGKTYTETLAVNGSRWKLPTTTFSRYWKRANDGFKLILEERKRVRERLLLEEEKKAVKRQIMTKEKKLEILESFISGEQVSVTFFDKGTPKHTKGFPTVLERVRSIEIHNRVTGDNAPDRHVVDVNKGAVNLDNLSAEERKLLVKMGELL